MSKARDLADTVSTGGILDDGTVSVSEISDLTVTAAELNNVAGVNSDVQTQLDLKAPLASPTFTGDATFDTDTFYVNGTSDYVGIGTTSQLAAGSRVSVQADGDYAPAITVSSNASATNWARIDFKNTNASDTGIIYQDQSGNFSIRNDGASPISFLTNGANERMRIDSSGNVGINTSSAVPLDANAQLLAIHGDAVGAERAQIKLTTTTSGQAAGDGFYIAVDDSAAYISQRENQPLVISTNATERFRIGSSGELGIGGANYGTAGQVLTSGGSGAAPTWADAAAGGAAFSAF